MKIKYTTKKITLLDNFFAGKFNIKFLSKEEYTSILTHLKEIGVHFIIGDIKGENFNPDKYLGYLSDDTIDQNIGSQRTGIMSKQSLIEENRRLVTVTLAKIGCGWSQDIKDRPLILASDILKQIYENQVENK